MGRLLMLGAVVAFMLAPASALGQWSDNFDSYAVDSSLHGQGGWKGWDNTPGATAYVRNTYSLSAPHSAEIAGGSDLVHEYAETSGQWTYTAYQYIPDTFSGTSYFIMLNMYNDGSPYDWSIQLPFDSATGTVADDFVTGASLPIIYDQWVEIRVEIDLDNDYREVYYGGTLLAANTWTTGTGSLLEIGAVDLFANNASPIYYDDISLVPEPATCLLLACAAVIGLRRR